MLICFFGGFYCLMFDIILVMQICKNSIWWKKIKENEKQHNGSRSIKLILKKIIWEDRDIWIWSLCVLLGHLCVCLLGHLLGHLLCVFTWPSFCVFLLGHLCVFLLGHLFLCFYSAIFVCVYSAISLNRKLCIMRFLGWKNLL